jgi:hypothetical protein
LIESYEGNEIINNGTGKELTINEFAEMLKRIDGYEGGIVFDHSKIGRWNT